MTNRYVTILTLVLSLLISNVYAQTPLTTQEKMEAERFTRQFFTEHASSASSAEYMQLQVVHLDEHIIVLGSQLARCGIVLVRNHDVMSLNNVLAYSTESIIRPTTNCMQKLLQYYNQVAKTLCDTQNEDFDLSSFASTPCLLEKNGAGKIHQFNYEDNVKGFRVSHTAGCGIVQIMQLMSYWDFPKRVENYNCREKHQDKLRLVIAQNDVIPSVAGHDREDLKLQAQVIGIVSNSEYHNGWTQTTNLGTLHALTAHLGYSRRLDLHYQSTVSKMYRLINEDIIHQRPCLITGGEHGFVCDGINNEFLHFNFGWGGHANGWYRFPLTDEKIGTGFIRSYITGIEPRKQ